MGDRIAVMSGGVIKQLGTPKEVYENPQNVFVASFIGAPAMNVVPAAAIGAGGSGLLAGLRPEHVGVANGAHGDEVRFDGRVEAIEYLGEEQLVHALVGDETILAKVPTDVAIAPGEQKTFSLPRRHLFLYDAATEERVNR